MQNRPDIHNSRGSDFDIRATPAFFNPPEGKAPEPVSIKLGRINFYLDTEKFNDDLTKAIFYNTQCINVSINPVVYLPNAHLSETQKTIVLTLNQDPE